MPPYLEQLEDRVRGAAVCRRYADTVRLSGEFAEAVRAYADGFPKGDPRAGEAARRLIELLSWTLVMLQATRATCAAELRKVTTANRYSRRLVEPVRAAGIYLDA